MSENKEDTFESTPWGNQDEDAQAKDSATPQPDQPEVTGGEEPNPASSPENLLPPEAQGETNGGPLGCCLGTMVGLLLSLSLAIFSRAYAEPLGQLFQNNYWLLGLTVRILMGILAFALAILCGRFGWKLGKRFYREYEPPVVKQRKRRSQPKRLQHKA